MSKADKTISLWGKSRAGAWAARGFHYQHQFVVLLLLRQWAGFDRHASIVPEGLEDCVIETPESETWLQIKSRKEGHFSDSEISNIQHQVQKRATRHDSDKSLIIAVGLEQSPRTLEVSGWASLYDASRSPVVVCSDPASESVELIATRLRVAEEIASGLFELLYNVVAETSATNANVPYVDRQQLTPNDIERYIHRRMEASDPSAVEEALAARIIEPIDFASPIPEPAFYSGVKVQPGHIASGLVFPREAQVERLIAGLERKRQALVAGPSGSGKSATMWLGVQQMAAKARWFSVNQCGSPEDVDAIIKFIRARRPSSEAPIGIAFDDVGTYGPAVWNAISQNLLQVGGVYLVGSIRQEDLHLIANKSEVSFIDSALDEHAAERLWQALRERNETTWKHWREPFEASEGLILEYVHILTQGERLAAVIQEQIRRRQSEKRYDELSIIRSASLISSLGGRIVAKTLFSSLDLEKDKATQALQRLLDEHLVRESEPGILGGLHDLRSQALCEASHDEVVYLSADTIQLTLAAVDPRSLPHVIHQVLSNDEAFDHEASLRMFASLLETSGNLDTWIAVLTGLGLGTLQAKAHAFIRALENEELDRGLWPVASMLSAADEELPAMDQFENWDQIRRAISSFHKTDFIDLRKQCLDMVSDNTPIPQISNLTDANRLLSTLVPIVTGEGISFTPDVNLVGGDTADVFEVARLLETASLIDRNLAVDLVTSLGGETRLFKWFNEQIPWVAPVTIETDCVEGRIVKTDWFLVSEKYQTDPHQSVIEICETLLALSPQSDLVSCDVVDPLGQLIEFNGMAICSKRMPRRNVHGKARVAWNVAFRELVLRECSQDNKTEYASKLAGLIVRTDKLLKEFTEKWITGKLVTTDAIFAEMKVIVAETKSIAFSAPTAILPEMTEPNGSKVSHDSSGGLITGIFGNLLLRVTRCPFDENCKATATFAGDLASQSIELLDSQLWRAIGKAPTDNLKSICERLKNLSAVLHEMNENVADDFVSGLIKFAKKSPRGKSLRQVAQRCQHRSAKRLRETIRDVEAKLSASGIRANILSRERNEVDSVYWPDFDLAVLVMVEDSEHEAARINQALEICASQIGSKCPFSVVPVMNGHLLSHLAMRPSALGSDALPYLTFEDEWRGEEGITIPTHHASDAFDQALQACQTISGIIRCRDVKSLSDEEVKVFDAATDDFKRNRDCLADTAEALGLEEFDYALALAEDTWNDVVSEFELAETGGQSENPLCSLISIALSGGEDDRLSEIIGIRIVLRQAEATIATMPI